MGKTTLSGDVENLGFTGKCFLCYNECGFRTIQQNKEFMTTCESESFFIKKTKVMGKERKMKPDSEKARAIFVSLATRIRTLFATLSTRKEEITSKIVFKNPFKPSERKVRLQKTRAYFKEYKLRRKQNEDTDSKFFSLTGVRTRLPALGGAFEALGRNLADGKGKFAVIALLVSLSITGITGIAIANSQQNAVSVKVDGEQIALVADQAEAKKVLESLMKEKADQWKRKIIITEEIEFIEVKAKKYEIDRISTLKPALEKHLNFVGVVAGIKVDGKILAVVEDGATANKVIDTIKEKYSTHLNDMQIESIGFRENIEIAEVPVTLREVVDYDKAVELLTNGQEKSKVHVVQSGESLWTIARKYDTRVVALKQANPELKGEKLDIGQELKLVRVEPLLTVEVAVKTTVKESVAYKVKVETDKSMYKGQQKVKQKGENGSREVTYKLVFANGVEKEREVLHEKVLQAAKDQVVVRGAKLVVASRGGGGKLAWPTSGRITSKYGPRWGRMHTGIDIDGTKGQAVGAAADGKVVSTGWDGGYGKQVTIDHGDGMKTKYAHLSSINVSVGDRVSRGELIGKVGSTGRSTGSHLHFEVIIGGSFRNPMNYLK